MEERIERAEGLQKTSREREKIRKENKKNADGEVTFEMVYNLVKEGDSRE